MPVDPSLASKSYCYLTTTGRVSGEPREIEIWFGLDGDTLYMLSGGRARSDWVKNLIRQSEVQVRLGDRIFEGRARSSAAETRTPAPASCCWRSTALATAATSRNGERRRSRSRSTWAERRANVR
jgi:hypothetical protein